MVFTKSLLTILVFFSFINIYSQKISTKNEITSPNYLENKYSIFTTWLSFSNFGNSNTNTHHYEILAGYSITKKDRIGIKVATWKLFAPMGIQFWDPKFLKESAFYPGRLKETGIGITYQRKLWKGLFATIEVLPLFKTYLDSNNQKLKKGFKLYTTYHVGYHIPLFKGKFFIEPQIHANYWPINTNTPNEFKIKEINTNNYFLFEPNLYLGVKF